MVAGPKTLWIYIYSSFGVTKARAGTLGKVNRPGIAGRLALSVRTSASFGRYPLTIDGVLRPSALLGSISFTIKTLLNVEHRKEIFWIAIRIRQNKPPLKIFAETGRLLELDDPQKVQLSAS